MSKKTLFIFLAFLLVVTLVTGWFVYRAKVAGNVAHPISEKSISSPPEKHPETSQDIPSVDTSDWKTYRNEEYGFEVKYPKEWESILARKGNSHGEVLSLSSPDTPNELVGAENQEGDNIVIHVFSDINKEIHLQNSGKTVKTLQDFFNLDMYVTETKLIRELEFHVKPAYLVYVFGFSGHYGLFLENKGRVYELVFEKTKASLGKESVLKENLRDILSNEEMIILNSLRVL